MLFRILLGFTLLIHASALADDTSDSRSRVRSPAVLPLPTDHPTDFDNTDMTLITEESWIEGEAPAVEF